MSAVCASAFPPARLIALATSSSSGAVRDALEQTAAERADSLGYPRAQQTMDDERLAQSHESGGVHGPGLESRGVRVVVPASGRKLQSRAPSEPRRSEEREVANPESAS